MIYGQSVKYDIALVPTSITNAATATSLQIDTQGFDHCAVAVMAATSNATTRPLTMRLTESDDTILTNYTAITAFSGTSNTVTSTSAGFVIPLARTATTRLPFAVFNVNCLYRKRYLTLEYSGTTTQIMSAIAVLSRAEIAPVSAADLNADIVVNG